MTDWYVRPASGSYPPADGTTYATAFDGDIGITWSMAAGDDFYAAGAFPETLTVETIDGTAAAPITIRGDYPGDAGSFDAENTREYCIYSPGRNYIHFREFTLQDADDGASANGENLKVANSTGVIVAFVVSSGARWNGVQLDYTTNCRAEYSSATGERIRAFSLSGDALGDLINSEVRSCTASGSGRRNFGASGVTSSVDTAYYSGFRGCVSSGSREGFRLDHGTGLYIIQCRSSGETVTGNDAEGTSPTNDNVYLFNSPSAVVAYNELIGNSLGRCIFFTAQAGLEGTNIIVQGNLLKGATADYAVYTNNTNVSGQTLTANRISGCVRGFRALNNTNQVFAQNTSYNTDEVFRAQTVIDSNNAEITNCLFSTGNSNGFVYANVASGNVFTVNGNHYHAASGTLARYNGTNYTSADITTLDANATTGDPLFKDAANDDFRLGAQSPCHASGIHWWAGEAPRGADGLRYNLKPSKGAYEVRRNSGHMRSAGLTPVNVLSGGLDRAMLKAA